jgi:hypothetical protein
MDDDVGTIDHQKMLITLPCPNLRRGIYEFDQSIDVDLKLVIYGL